MKNKQNKHLPFPYLVGPEKGHNALLLLAFLQKSLENNCKESDGKCPKPCKKRKDIKL